MVNWLYFRDIGIVSYTFECVKWCLSSRESEHHFILFCWTCIKCYVRHASDSLRAHAILLSLFFLLAYALFVSIACKFDTLKWEYTLYWAFNVHGCRAIARYNVNNEIERVRVHRFRFPYPRPSHFQWYFQTVWLCLQSVAYWMLSNKQQTDFDIITKHKNIYRRLHQQEKPIHLSY